MRRLKIKVTKTFFEWYHTLQIAARFLFFSSMQHIYQYSKISSAYFESFENINRIYSVCTILTSNSLKCESCFAFSEHIVAPPPLQARNIVGKPSKMVVLFPRIDVLTNWDTTKNVQKFDWNSGTLSTRTVYTRFLTKRLLTSSQRLCTKRYFCCNLRDTV